MLSQSVLSAPSKYNATLVSGISEMANRLKFYDPERMQTGEEGNDPYWLTQMQQVVSAFQVMIEAYFYFISILISLYSLFFLFPLASSPGWFLATPSLALPHPNSTTRPKLHHG